MGRLDVLLIYGKYKVNNASVGIIYDGDLISFKDKGKNGRFKFNLPKEYENKNLILRVRELYFKPYETHFKMRDNSIIGISLFADANISNLDYDDYLKANLLEIRRKKFKRILYVV